MHYSGSAVLVHHVRVFAVAVVFGIRSTKWNISTEDSCLIKIASGQHAGFSNSFTITVKAVLPRSVLEQKKHSQNLILESATDLLPYNTKASYHFDRCNLRIASFLEFHSLAKPSAFAPHPRCDQDSTTLEISLSFVRVPLTFA